MNFTNEELLDICNTFTLSKAKNIDEESNNLSKFICKWAEKLNIGRMKIIFILPKNMYSNEIVQKEITILEDAHTEDMLCKEYDFLHNGHINVKVNAANDVFSDLQKENLFFLFDIIYSNYAKFKAFELILGSKFYDSLTGSINTVGMLRKFNELNIDISNYTCCFVNIFNFKSYNQRFSFKNGNIILRDFYLKFNENFEEDELFGRLGGDNFLCLVKNENLDKLVSKFDNVCLTVNINNEDKIVNLKLRAGIYSAKKEDSLTNAIDKASIAINVCKGLKDANVFYFTDDFAAKITIEQQVLSSFPKSIEKEEFVVFYQPKVDVRTKQICGAEALVRWRKDNNYIGPTNFTPVLEREHLINVLDMYMFEHVCKDIRLFLEQGLEPVRVSVNFSRSNLKEENFYESIINIMEKYNIDSKYIEMEITETSMYEDSKTLRPLIEKLAKRGIFISVDDFGTGYSSLNFIKDYPFNVIKIDKSFIDSINTNDERNLLFLKNILQLIKDLNILIVAEGVENEKQLNFLAQNGCNIIQGFIFDKPLKKKDFETRLINRVYGG